MPYLQTFLLREMTYKNIYSAANVFEKQKLQLYMNSNLFVHLWKITLTMYSNGSKKRDEIILICYPLEKDKM